MPATTPEPGQPWHRQEKSKEVLQSELDIINERRKANERARLANDPAAPPFKNVVMPGDKPLAVVGLALSGGGIRSAAVCLGVLQALNNYRLLPHIDYLSTVSGGGYIGSAWSAAVAVGDGRFPFGDIATKSREELARDKPTADEVSDTPAVAHIRNYSNFIIPGGFRDVLTGITIVLRGLAANVAIVLPLVLLGAALTIYSNPTRSSLTVTDLFGVAVGDWTTRNLLICAAIGVALGLLLPLLQRYVFGGRQPANILIANGIYVVLGATWIGLNGLLAGYLNVQNFGLTLATFLLSLAMYIVWSVARSALRYGPEFRGYVPTVAAIGLVLFAVTAFFEAQPFLIDAMFDASVGSGNAFVGVIAKWSKEIAAASASLGIVVTFLRQQIANVLKSDAGSGVGGIARMFVAKAAVWFGGLALPVLIWIGYLHLAMWGIANDKADLLPCIAAPASQMDVCIGAMQVVHTPDWITKISPGREQVEQEQLPFNLGGVPPVARLFAVVALALLLISCLLKPNANSLHRLYRDRLGKAFLFNRSGPRDPFTEDFPPADEIKLSALSDTRAPYHLIGAALNIQGSTFANRRGRNADFFLFSKNWIGSEATDYAPTKRLEERRKTLDLATAMAISGAAASSNMGAASIRPLTPTLALLNIRLGYWLHNPRFFLEEKYGAMKRGLVAQWSAAYLFQELSGRLHETSESVYLTDGGHIENLGIYELLRRRCKVILAVDAEADPEMHFPSFVTLQRYARIDLGIIIDLPWSPIRNHTLKAMADNAMPQPKGDPKHGPHVAIGTINYGGGQIGYLVYIKSSLSGDENDYIRDYARRFSTFPHESTIEQFFSEEQFEVYRSLGFHMTHGWLKPEGADCIVIDDGKGKCPLRQFTDSVKALDEIRLALRWPPPSEDFQI